MFERGQWPGHVGVPFDGLEAVLESVAGAVDRDDVSVVQEPVEDHGGEDLVTGSRTGRPTSARSGPAGAALMSAGVANVPSYVWQPPRSPVATHRSGAPAMKGLPQTDETLLIRTDVPDEAAW